MQKEKKLVPLLRFSQFSNNWKSIKLGDIAKFSKGKGISKSDIVVDGINECIRYGELYTTYDEVINVISSRTNVELVNSILSDKNDVIIPSSGETQLDIATASCVLKNGVILGGDLNIIKSNINGVFLSYLLNNSKKKDIAKLAQGNTVVHLYNKQLATLSLKLPSSEEQQKIAAFLTAIDTKITQLTKKKTLLEQYKKGIMQKIFPSTSSGQEPKLRFKPDPSGVEGDDHGKAFSKWEEKKLGEVCKKIQDGNYGASYPKSDEFVETGVPFLTSKAIGGGGSIISDKIDYISTEKHQELKKAQLKINDVLFTNRGANVGAVALVDETIAHGNIGPQLTLLRVEKNIATSKFLFQSMNCFSVRKQISSQDSGSAMNFFGIGATSKFKIKIPSIEEQTKIANFLSDIDIKIEALNTKLENNKTFKKGLLQKMFV